MRQNQSVYCMLWSWMISGMILSLNIRCTSCNSCFRHTCHGDVGSLNAGRTVQVSSWCGDDIEPQNFCTSLDGCRNTTVCALCDNGDHPPSHMVDSPFVNANTWWQSKQVSADERVVLRFDLETSFYFTHLIMVFHSSRPGAMILERSVDNGRSWQIYQYYAHNCSETFGLDDDDSNFRSFCTSRYSQKEPCTRGEVIYRVLNPTNLIQDPYSASSRHLMKVTNLRIQMWNPQQCGECEKVGFNYFSVYDLIVRGTCFCNGHADSCTSMQRGVNEPQDKYQSVVHGKCLCEHHTTGDHCERCSPLYNDAPWRAGNGETGAANECKRCNCHGHAKSCKFDIAVWRSTGEISGGVCVNCGDNTAGRKCGQCAKGFFRTPDSYLTDPDVCQACECNPTGTITTDPIYNEDEEIIETGEISPCDPMTGKCRCKEGVTGRRCDRCKRGYAQFGPNGCVQCACEWCDQASGSCYRDLDRELGGVLDAEFDVLRKGINVYEPDINEGIYYPPVREAAFKEDGVDVYSESRFPERYPEYARLPIAPVLPEFEPIHKSRTAPAFVSWHSAEAECECKEKEIKDISKLCKKDFDYGIKARILKAEDVGSDVHLLVAVKRILKEGKVKIRKSKMTIFPVSWMKMGCTCPVLIPGSEYVIIGNEDLENKRLIVNTKSFVKRWSHGKHWIRQVVKLFRKKCD